MGNLRDNGKHPLRLALLVLVATTLFAGCGSERPSAEAWQQTWQRMALAVPSEEALGDSPSPDDCGDVVAFLRSNREDLFPTPDRAIDDPVNLWIQTAEDAFFECPPNNPEIRGFPEAFRQLARLEAEIELVLDMDINQP